MTNDEQVSNGVQTAGTATQSKYTAETILRTRPHTYRKAALFLADPDWSKNRICRALRITEHSLNAIEKRETTAITERKNSLAALMSNIAEIGGATVERKIGKAGVRDAIIGTGVAIDKYLALLGLNQNQVNVAIVMPTEKEREERDARFARLEAMTARLALPPTT